VKEPSKNRFTIADDESHSEEDHYTDNQPSMRFYGVNTSRPVNPASRKRKKIIAYAGLITAVALLTTLTVFLVIKFKKPDTFLGIGKDSTSQTSGIVSPDKLDIPQTDSQNEHLLKGKGYYYKGYLNEAMAEFAEVVESSAPDKDKAVALTYMGIIEDTRSNYTKALEYYSRAIKYDPSNSGTFRNLAITYKNMGKYDEALRYVEKAIDLDPKSANNHILQGNLYFLLNRYTDAIKSYEHALEHDKSNASALFNIAQSYSKMGKDAQAITYLKDAAEADKGGNIAYMSYAKLGLIYLSLKDYPNAEVNLNRAVAINGNDPIDHYNLGIAYLEQGKKEEAIRAFMKAESISAENSQMLESLGEAYTSLNEYDRALEIYQRMIKINSRNTKVLALLGDLYYQKGELEQAIRFYTKITEIEPASERARTAFINMGIALDDAQRFEEAIEAYEHALSINGKDDIALYNLGLAYKHAGKPEKALLSWKRATEINPDNEKPLIARADLLYERGEFDEALEAYGLIADKWPLLPRPQFSIAAIYHKRGQLDYAKKRYLKVVELNTDAELTRKSYINLGMIASQDKKDAGEFNEAVGYVQKALLVTPNDPEALQSLGIIYSRKGTYDRAIEAFYQVIKSSRDQKLSAQAYNQIGICYYRKADYKKALRAFTQGNEEDPANEEIRMNRSSAMRAYEKTLGE
jgi:tetratricopeptide (TPR) repeat protein